MTTILVTGYGPFANTPVNPAEKVARALDGATIDGATVAARILPNVFFEVIGMVGEAIQELKPEAVIMMGEFGGRPDLTVERIAQNLNDSTRYGVTDNNGYAIQDEMTAPDGPAAYYATVPIRAMVKAMRDAGVPADISDCAATFGCNHLMYGVLHHIAMNGLPVRAGWVHLPALPEVAALEANVGMPSMSVETAVMGLRAGISAIFAHPTDINDPIRSRMQI